MSIIIVLFLTDWTIFPCISGDTITVEIIHLICTISTILARLTSTVINVCVIIKKMDVDQQIEWSKTDITNQYSFYKELNQRLVKIYTNHEAKKTFEKRPKNRGKNESWRLQDVNNKRDIPHRLNNFSLHIRRHNHSGNHSLDLYNFHHSGTVDQHSHQCLRYNKKWVLTNRCKTDIANQ